MEMGDRGEGKGKIMKETIHAQIAKRIKMLREQNDVSQQSFYNDTNIHIGRIEAGHSNLTISTLCEICNYFEITLGDFFTEMRC
jgi:transcriptional regulator with XRE-family HTH domain